MSRATNKDFSWLLNLSLHGTSYGLALPEGLLLTFNHTIFVSLFIQNNCDIKSWNICLVAEKNKVTLNHIKYLSHWRTGSNEWYKVSILKETLTLHCVTFWCAAGNILITRVMDYFHEYISITTDMVLELKYQFFFNRWLTNWKKYQKKSLYILLEDGMI